MEMSVIYDYLVNEKYPRNYNSADRRTLRKRARDFTIKGQEMYHVTIETDEDGEDLRIIERLVLRTQCDRWQAITDAHEDIKGSLDSLDHINGGTF